MHRTHDGHPRPRPAPQATPHATPSGATPSTTAQPPHEQPGATPAGSALPRALDLNLLVLFDALYQHRNLTTTGVRLGLSQPAVSRALARLRQMYGDALFVRQPRGVVPTPFADGLAEPVAAALAIVRGTVERPLFAPARHARRFTLAMSDIGERYFLPRLLAHLAQQAPGVTVQAVSSPPAGLADALASGEIDLALGFLPALGKQVLRQRLFMERFVYIARQGHPQVRGALATGQLRGLGHVVANPPGTPHAAAVEKVLASRRVRAPVVLQVRSFLSVGPIVADTDLVAPVPNNLATLVAEHLGLQLIPPPVSIPGFEVSLGWHQRYHRDPGNVWLRSTLAALFAQR